MTGREREAGERGQDLRARAAFLELVAQLWFAPAEERHLEGLGALGEIFPSSRLGRFSDPAQIGDLKSAFDAHLRVPGGRALLPYETSHLPATERERGPERMAQVAGLYATAGFDMEPNTQFPPDHVGHELRFVAALFRREAGLEPGSSAAENVLGWRTGFVREHLGFCAAGLVARVRAVEAHPFFVGLADVTAALVDEDAEVPAQPY